MDTAEPAADVAPLALYILVRDDLDSLNAGKAVAQGSHAATKMVWDAERMGYPNLLADIRRWHEDGQGFGTAIAKAASIDVIRERVHAAHDGHLHASMVLDPTYPLRDGRVVHHFPLHTCAYIFGPVDVAGPMLRDLPLMP